MKHTIFKLALLSLFQVIGFSFLAQQKDSLAATPFEVKEDLNAKRTRKYFYFVSTRLSDDDKYDIFKTTPGTPPALIVIRGHFEIIGNPNEKKAKISIYNSSNNELVGVYNTNAYTGNYLLILAPNLKYQFKVEATGYGTSQETVEIPLKIDFEICQQDIKIKLNEKNKATLLINSFFADENEKVVYLKSFVDTTKLNESAGATEELAKQVDKNGKLYSNIDELVKKQLEEEKKKPAEALAAFNTNDFEKALPLYELLLKNDQADPFINYYYGVCMFKLNQNKAKVINSLLVATGIKEIPADVWFYLGRAYHLSYLFSDAIKAFEQYKARVKPYDFEGNYGPLLIKNCINGSMLMSDQVNVEVVKRTPMQLENLLTNYNPDLINEKVKLKPEFFATSIDKKKQIPLFLCSTNPREYYHASFGEKEQNNTDLYKNILLPNGAFGPNQYIGMGPEINSPYDENYPYLAKDGNTLYFSSKGHNSMGGYDIFKITRKDSVSPWSKPQNLGYPINSTYDDILFIPDESNQTASYCTNRKNNSYEYTQIKLPQHELASSIIKGQFSTLDSIPGKEAYITVYNSNTGEIAGVYKTNPNTGLYLMILTSGTKYDLSVEAEGYSEQKGIFDVPDKKGEFELKQIIKVQTLAGQKTIKLANYFTEAEAAKISFDIAPIPTSTITIKTGDKSDVNAVVKIKKPKRAVEEAMKDKENLNLAIQLFNQNVYQEAALIYQNLDLFIDLQSMDAYRYGVCLFNTKKDKTNCILAFESCVNDKTVPIDVYYFLAKANHASYRFNTAINYYNKYMAVCKPEDIKSLKIEQEIVHCRSGIKLVNNPIALEVYGRKHVDLTAIQNSLTQLESGGKVLVITDDMRSEIDKKKDFKSLLFLTADKSVLLYTSYGDDESHGKDIYMLKKMANGKWAPLAQNISSINSSLDEEYPSLSKDGKTLYFSSKGHENMGEYDIFKSVWDEKMGVWSAPINMGSPINSPFDDIYFLE